MVKLSLEMKKKDLVWIVPIFVVLVLGVAVAYVYDGSGNPEVMGHSAGELDVSSGVQVADTITSESVSFSGGVWNSITLNDVPAKSIVYLLLDGGGQFCAVRPKGDTTNFPSHSGDYNTHGANQGMVDARHPMVITPTDSNGDIDLYCTSAGTMSIQVLGYIPYE